MSKNLNEELSRVEDKLARQEYCLSETEKRGYGSDVTSIHQNQIDKLKKERGNLRDKLYDSRNN